jgi:hypothetical protein
MRIPNAQIEQLYAELPALAEATRALFTLKPPGLTDTDVLREIIIGNDLVFGIYRDPTEPRGFGVTTIKGRAILSRSIEENRSVDAKTTAVMCREEAEALAMSAVFGDDANVH